MNLNRYEYYKDRIEDDQSSLVQETQSKLDMSTSKKQDYEILAEFWDELASSESWTDDEYDELFNDSYAMMPMPESVSKQMVNMLFDIKHLNVLMDLDIYEGFD